MTGKNMLLMIYYEKAADIVSQTDGNLRASVFQKMANALEQKYTTRQCITARNLLYHYIDSGPLQGRVGSTVLLLHGHGDYSFGWRDVIPELRSKGFRCITPDLLGFGKTSKPVEKEAYRTKLMCTDIMELLSSAGIPKDEKLVVIAHDWGTNLASRLALHYPERLSSVVLVAAPYMPPFPQPTTLEQFTTMMPNFSYWNFFVSDACPILLRNNMAFFWKSVVCTGNETPPPMSELERMLVSGEAEKTTSGLPALWDQATYDAYTSTYLRGGWEAPMNWYKAFVDNFEDEKQFAGVKFGHPMLMIVGSNDPAVPPRVAEQSKQFLGKAMVIHLPCGHWITQEKGAELAQLVVKWLKSDGTLDGA